MSEIRELHAVDRRRQAVTSEMLTAGHMRFVTTLHGQVTALQGQVTALQGQQGPVRGPAQPDLPEEADIDSDAVITGTYDHTTGTCDSTTRTGYHTAGTVGTCWRSCIARAARGGW
ncbi:hypothetical protein Tco_0125429 [Tanacetum coccineum]